MATTMASPLCAQNLRLVLRISTPLRPVSTRFIITPPTQRTILSLCHPKSTRQPACTTSSSLSSISKSKSLKKRQASTATSTTPLASSKPYTTKPSPTPINSSSSSSPSHPDGVLTWNAYLTLRTKRRRLNLFFSSITALIATGTGAAFLGTADTDKLGAFGFGMDPVFVLGAATAACGMVGWLAGPFVGGAVFGLAYRRVAGAMRDKETEFYRRVKKYRSDPAGQSVNNPVPDYYGEKITSVRDYRRWLKDQRAFRRKREVNVI